MAKAPPIRTVLIVDDHPLYSDALAGIVERIIAPERVEIAASMSETYCLLEAPFSPDLIFLDLNLPDVTGISGLLSLQKRAGNSRIAVISATKSPEIITLVADTSAVGYISKNLERDELLNAVATIGRGGFYFPPEWMLDAPPISESSPPSPLSTRLASLTPQQLRILEMICQGKLNKQIAFELGLAEATVKTHITALMRKLNVQSRTQAALLVRDAISVSNLE